MRFPALIRRVIAALTERRYEGASHVPRMRSVGSIQYQRANMLAARGTLAARARSLVANNPLATAGVEAWVVHAIGPGIKPQSAHPDPIIRERINAAFNAWTDSADADGLVDFYGMQALAMRRMIQDGDAFGVMIVAPVAGNPLRLRLYDAEQIDPTLSRDLLNGGRIVFGKELDASGQFRAIWVWRERPGLPLVTSLDHVRIPAEDVAHLYRIETPGQVRGLSWFASVLLRVVEHDSAMDAQLVRQKIAAMLAGFIVDANGDAAGFDGDKKGSILDGGLEPGTLKTLPPGADIRFSEAASVGPEVIEFLRITAREIAAGLGVPYETMTGDLSGTNYSSIRAGLLDFRRRIEAVQFNTVVFQFCRPIWRRFVTLGALTGTLDLPGFLQDPEPYLAARWIAPRLDWVDPQKDVTAEIAAINAGLMSRREAVAGRGYDLEDLDREIAEDNASAERFGLAFGQPAAPVPNSGVAS